MPQSVIPCDGGKHRLQKNINYLRSALTFLQASSSEVFDIPTLEMMVVFGKVNITATRCFVRV